jgi:hypothetical protein
MGSVRGRGGGSETFRAAANSPGAPTTAAPTTWPSFNAATAPLSSCAAETTPMYFVVNSSP